MSHPDCLLLLYCDAGKADSQTLLKVMVKGKNTEQKRHKLMKAYCCISYLSDYTYTCLCAGQNCIQCRFNLVLYNPV